MGWVVVIAKSPSTDGERPAEPDKQQPAVLITGRGTDIAFNLNENAPLEEVVKELDVQLEGQSTLFSQGGISVNTGNRRLNDDEEDEIRRIFRDKSGLRISRFVSSSEQSAEADPKAEDAVEQPGFLFSNGQVAEVPKLAVEEPPVRRTRNNSTPLAEFSSADLARALSGLSPLGQRTHYRAMVVRGTIRSGETVSHNGDILVLGDVNPGSEIIADGDIIVMGALKGLPHAGAAGDSKAAVIALSISASRLRIGNCEANAPADDSDGSTARWKKHPVDPQPKIAYVRRGTVYVSPFAGRFARYTKGVPYEG